MLKERLEFMFLRKIDDLGLFQEDVILDAIPYEMETVKEYIKDDDGNIINEIVKEQIVMKSVYDELGNFLYMEPVLDHHYIEELCPEGFYIPKWDTNHWIEGASQQYIDEKNGVVPETTTDEKLEELALNVNDALLAIMMLSIE